MRTEIRQESGIILIRAELLNGSSTSMKCYADAATLPRDYCFRNGQKD